MAIFVAAVVGSMLFRTVLVLMGMCLFGTLSLANGVLALASPRRWVRAPWTATRGFNREAGSLEEFWLIRVFGAVMFASGVFVLYMFFRGIAGVIRDYQ